LHKKEKLAQEFSKFFVLVQETNLQNSCASYMFHVQVL